MSSVFNTIRRNLFLRILVFGILLNTLACMEIIEIPEDYFDEYIAVNAVLDSDSTSRIHVSKSMPPAGSITFDFIDQAQLHIINMGNKDSIHYAYEHNGWYTSQDQVLQPASEYSIEIILPDRIPITANTIIPRKPEIVNERLKYDSIMFTVIDDPNYDEYYLVTLYGYNHLYDYIQTGDTAYEDWRYDYLPLELECEDAIIDAIIDRRTGHVNKITGLEFTEDFFDIVPDYTGRSFLFSDASFSGDSKDLLFRITDRGLWYIDSIRKVDLIIHSIDYNYYQYLLTFAQYWTTDETPFMERVSIYSNINHGIGIFGSKNGVSKEFILSEDLVEKSE